jgi:hypothetical protein
MKSDYSKCVILRQKYCKTRLRASVNSKIFPGVLPRTPVKKGKGRGGEGRGGEGRGGEGREGEGNPHFSTQDYALAVSARITNELMGGAVGLLGGPLDPQKNELLGGRYTY